MESVRSAIVFGDTHVPDRTDRMPTWVLDLYDDVGADVVIGTGDYSSDAVVYLFNRFVGVRGNEDVVELPYFVWIRIAGRLYLVTHGHLISNPILFARRMHANLLFGHSHEPGIFVAGQNLAINPGTASGLNRRQVETVAVIEEDCVRIVQRNGREYAKARFGTDQDVPMSL